MKFISLFIFTLLLTGCGNFINHKEKSSSSDLKSDLEDMVKIKKARLIEISDKESGWPSVTDCDGTKWAGLSCAAGMPVKIGLAEYPEGVRNRRPAPACWNLKEGDVGSRSTYSNDMVSGDFWCHWETKDLMPLQRFASASEKRDWQIGEPITEPGEVVMKTNGIGMLGRLIFLLSGGKDDRYYRRLFRLYLPVAEDYERHIQALDITLQGEVTAALNANSLDATVQAEDGSGLSLLDINDSMLKRLQDLAATEPKNSGFAIALGVYTGDLAPAVKMHLDSATPVPSYVRGDQPEAFALAEWLFWAHIALKHLK